MAENRVFEARSHFNVHVEEDSVGKSDALQESDCKLQWKLVMPLPK